VNFVQEHLIVVIPGQMSVRHILHIISLSKSTVTSKTKLLKKRQSGLTERNKTCLSQISACS